MTYEKKKVLITVKTYPHPSSTYQELVCTAGVFEEELWELQDMDKTSLGIIRPREISDFIVEPCADEWFFCDLIVFS